MSNATKKSRRINVIDIIVILLVLALIATAVFKIYSEITNGASNKQGNYIVTFECDSEYRELMSYLKSGTAVYLVSNGTLIGYLYDAPGDELGAVYEIESVEEGAAEAENESSDPYEKIRFGGSLKLASNAVKSKTGNYYTVEDRNISVGTTLNVYTEKAVFTLTVKSIGAE